MKSKSEGNAFQCLETQETGCECVDELAAELMDIHMRYMKQISQLAEVLSASGEYGILHYLCREQRSFTAGELSEALGLTPGRVANILKALEKKKRILRTKDSEDRRKINVSITEAGKDYVFHVHTQTAALHRDLVKGIGEEDTRNFIRVTKKLFALASENIQS